MIEALLLPFELPFMQNAFLIGAIVAVPTALLSCYLVLKGWALMGDAVSHAILPGVVAAYLLGLPLILGAFAAGMLCTVASGYLSASTRVKPDTVMGVVFSGMFASGLVIYVAVPTSMHLDHILFGNMLGVDARMLRDTALIAAVVTAALLIGRRWLLVHTFDPVQARALGLPVGLIHYGLLALISATIVATLTATGLILAVGLLITPGAIAFLLTRRFAAMQLAAVLVCEAAMLGGIWTSFHLDSATGPTVILLLTLTFAVVLLGRRAGRLRHRTEPRLDARSHLSHTDR
ncbi:hypothetical protein GI374_17250 [Paracoccus sp. S-4012]|uniref:metal ABC transporter permease n=1 Tax=Paracoccus sp. S-4012 TaxID=2665648 RepID=UPI0012B07918|nr:metal ABC transporter permease [Paracoccus sp. S-4012]MRX52124.1 hypothetical protein [Paracoccus sp. S-4012]